MKKNIFLGIFLIIASFFAIIPKQIAYGELSGYSINIFAQITTSASSGYLDAENFNTTSNTYNGDYSDFGTDGSIVFIGQVVSSQEGDTPIFAYEWKTSAGTILTNSASLILYKKASDANQPLILIGETKYVLTVTNTEDNTFEQIVVTTKIADVSKTCSIQTFAPTIPAEMDSNSGNLAFTAKLPIVNGSVINWYLKTPKSIGYNLTKSNVENYVFTAKTTINNSNGFGKYKIMAIAYNKNTNEYYYSQTFEINGVETAKTIGESEYKIIYKKIDNSKANIEAFYYTIENSDNLNEENIIWYIGDLKVHRGKDFTYEPTTTENYRVTAKYLKADGTIIELSELKQQPATTGTYILFICIGVAIVILSTIFAISIKVTNKKRDVVW